MEAETETKERSEAVVQTRSGFLEERLEALARQRMAGAYISDDLMSLRNVLGKEAFAILAHALSPMSDERAQEMLASDNLPQEDLDRLLEWRMRFRHLSASFLEASRLRDGRNNVWQTLKFDMMISFNEDVLVDWSILNAEKKVIFQSTDTPESVFRLAVYLVQNIAKFSEELVETRSEKDVNEYRKFVETLQKASDNFRKYIEAHDKAQEPVEEP